MKKNILWLMMLLCSFKLQAQTESIQRINIKSPEVAAFMKVGELPVSLYTGIPQVSIPICNIECGELKLPVTLDYQGTAIQVNQEATWVGLNWLLNAGGVVTTRKTLSKVGPSEADWKFLYNKLVLREVYNDDFGRHYKMEGCHEIGWPATYGFNAFKCIPIPRTNDLSHELYGHLLLNHEGEATSYSANFMGHNFNFIYHPLQKKYIVTGREKKYRIEGDPGTMCITDADGIRYTFGVIENNNPNASNSSLTNAPINQSFYLTEIKHPSGKTIKLKYKQYANIRLLPELQETWFYNLTNRPNYMVEKTLSPVLKIHNFYLHEIVTDEITVRFNIGTRTDLQGAKKLENIEVRDKAERLKKRFRLNYTYLTGNNIGGDRLREYYEEHNQLSAYQSLYTSSEINQRLILTSLQEETENGSGILHKLPAYNFTYNENLPAKTSSARDYWGFYNGKNNRTLLVDRSKQGESPYNNFPYALSSTYGDRRCNPSTIAGGMLSGITYPTGGSTSFRYEPHSFTNYAYYNTNQSEAPTRLYLSSMDSSIPNSIPPEYKLPDFTLSQPTTVEITMTYRCPIKLHWKEMLGSPAMIMVYDQHISNNAMHPYKTWTLSPADTLAAENGQFMRTESIVLPAGKYQLNARLSSPQIPWGPNYPGERRLEMRLKADIATDLASISTFQGGGIRIKDISQTDGNGNTMTTHYDYSLENGNSSGLLMTPLHFAREKLQLYQPDRGPSVPTPGGVYYPPVPTARLIKYWVSSSTNLSLPQGIAVGYGRVTVIRSEGKTVSEYWNKKNMGASSFDYMPQLSDPRNGNLVKESIYLASGKLMRESANTYSVLDKKHYYVNAIVEDIYNGPDECAPNGMGNDYAVANNGCRMLVSIYPSSSFHIECTRQVVKEYTDKGTKTTEKRYTYNPWNLQPATVQTILNNDLSETVHTLYPHNYAGTAYPKSLADAKHILNVPIERVWIVNRAGVSSVTNAKLYQYDGNGQPIVYSQLKLPIPMAVADFKFSNKDKGICGTDTTALKSYLPSTAYSMDTEWSYTSTGNLSTVTEKQSLTTVFLWSYSGQHVIAKISGTTYTQVKAALGYTDAQMSTLESNSSPDMAWIRSKLDAFYKDTTSQVTTYTWIPFVGITSKTEPNGNVTHYNYDVFTRLKSVTDHNGKIVKDYEYNYKNL